MAKEEISTIEQKPSIKLIRNSKGYGWEIRVLDLDIKRLEALNDEMIEKFGENDELSERG